MYICTHTHVYVCEYIYTYIHTCVYVIKCILRERVGGFRPGYLSLYPGVGSWKCRTGEVGKKEKDGDKAKHNCLL